MDHISSLMQISLSIHPICMPFIFILINIILAVFFLPCSPMAFIAGAIWGVFYGTIITILAAIASESITFLLSRRFFQYKIQKFLEYRYPKIQSLLLKVIDHDWKVILLVQLNPLIPAASMGYAFGLSNIQFKKYILYSALFMLPLTMLIVLTGSSVLSLLIDGHQLISVLLICLLVLSLKLIIKILSKFFSKIFGVQIDA
jgi:uncharacterized membrane protein YdjX (TVP38/TMEM64 family)